MKKLMISLDKKILDKNSRVAGRMVECGKKDELFILIPDKNKIKFDLSPTVHVWSTGGNKIKQFFILKNFGRKIIRKIKIELVTVQDPFFLGFVGIWLKKKTKVKLEVQLHGDFFGSDYYKKSGLKNFIYYYIGKRNIKKADKLRVVGERVKKSLFDLGVDESKIEVKAIFIDKEKIKIEKIKTDLHVKYPGFKKIFLILGRLEKIKNIDWLIEIFEKASKDYLLLIVGEGSEKESLIKKIKTLGLEKNIKLEEWTGDYVSYIKTADALLFPSLSEGYGLVPIEAEALGTKVIMNNVGVANFELKSGEKVKILPINNKEAWTEAIKEI